MKKLHIEDKLQQNDLWKKNEEETSIEEKHVKKKTENKYRRKS